MDKRPQGFTLVEVVISLALGGLILTAIMSLFVSFVQVWQVKKTPYESFIEHVDNCTRFLYDRLNAFKSISSDQPSSALQTEKKTDTPMGFHCIKLVPNDAILNGPWVLGMFTYKPLPFLHPSSAETSSAIYVLALGLTRNGLGFILEAPEIIKQHLSDGVEHTDKTIQKLLILSPHVISLEYAHFRPENGLWEFTKSLEDYCKQFAEKNFCQRPDGLRLKFKQEDFEVDRFILLRNDFESKAELPGTNKQKSQQKKEDHELRK